MEAIGLNPIRLDRIGLDPIRVNAIKLGVPGAASGSDRPYIDPEVLASLVAVCICDGKSNNDPDRAVIKNLVDPDNPFIISNAAYKLNSGYGKYEEDFTSWEYGRGVMVYHNKFIYTEDRTSPANIIHLKINKRAVNSFKIKVEGLPDGQILAYSYFKQENDNERTEFLMKQNGEYILPPSMTPSSTTEGRIGFYNTQYKGNIKGLTITQIPSHQGAFVTDGKDDLITSTKTVKEMLGGSNEVTVVSMIHQIGFISSRNYARNNYFIQGNDFLTNTISAIGKIGIYGYKGNLSNIAIVNDILGDKKDYSVDKANPANIDSVFSVNGTHSSAQLSQLAWYWTIIANKVLTTDQINQVISYFNLDKHVKPDVYYDTIRQGITNENHASFNDELVDFSGNGHNMKIYNSAWNKESGINDEGAWQADGVTDYGQYVGDLGLKDYTIAVDRAYVEAKPTQVSIMSNAVDGSTNTPFLMEHMGLNKIIAPHSFGKYTALSELNINRFISYQSTYKYNRNNLDRGTSTNTGSGLTIGRIGGVASQYANTALWSLLLFPYTLSEFLLERQLKRYKLGTLYPDMVEFRPIVKSNREYSSISYSVNPGEYISVDSMVTITVTLSNTSDKLIDVSCNAISDISISGDNGVYKITGKIVKSPQKIGIAVESDV